MMSFLEPYLLVGFEVLPCSTATTVRRCRLWGTTVSRSLLKMNPSLLKMNPLPLTDDVNARNKMLRPRLQLAGELEQSQNNTTHRILLD